MNSTAKRPRFLDLTKIRLPLPGIVSILHRISGVLMILAALTCYGIALNVAGPRESQHPGIQKEARAFLEIALSRVQ